MTTNGRRRWDIVLAVCGPPSPVFVEAEKLSRFGFEINQE